MVGSNGILNFGILFPLSIKGAALGRAQINPRPYSEGAQFESLYGVDCLSTKCYYHFETNVTINLKLSHY